MATVTHTTALPDSSEKTDFYSLVDNAQVTGIVNNDIASNAAIAGSKLATITTAGKVDGSAINNLANVPAGAGRLPSANLPSTIPVANIDTGTTADKIVKLDGSARIPAVNGSLLTNLTISGIIGSAVSKSDNTAYQATTDGFFVGIIDCSGSTGTYGEINGYADSNASPSTLIGVASAWRVDSTFSGSSGTRKNSFCIPVKKNDYYKGVLTTGGGSPSATYYFIPLGA